MDVELERDLNEALARLSALSANQDGCQMKDPVVKMMLVALLHEVGKIKDMVDGVGQRILDRYCEDFIPRKEVSAMPAVAVVSPVFRKGKDSETVSLSSEVSFSCKVTGSKTPVNFLPLFRNTLIPCEDVYVLTHNKMRGKDGVVDIEMENPASMWVGISTKAEIESLDGVALYIQNVVDVYPEHIFAVGGERTELSFRTMDRLEDLEMLEPFDSQQVSNESLAIMKYWKDYLQSLPDGVLVCLDDSRQDRDVFRKRAYPRVFQNWLESETLDRFKDNTIWLEISFPDGYSVSDDCQVALNAVPVVNVDVCGVTLTQAAPVAKLDKQEGTFFVKVLETSNKAYRQGFPMNSDDFIIRDFDAGCYHNGDLYRDIRNLYNHFVEDYYAFVEFNGLKDGQDIKRLKELVNRIGKSVGAQNSKYKFDSGTYVMKNINSGASASVTKISYLTTDGERGNLLKVDGGHRLECRKIPVIEPDVPVLVSAMGGRDKAGADERYELIRYYSLTNDRLFTKMDIDAFVRKELVAVFGKEEFKRIRLKINVAGAPGLHSVQRGLYVDIEFKDKKNYDKALGEGLQIKLQRKIESKSCISMPVMVRLYNCDMA